MAFTENGERLREELMNARDRSVDADEASLLRRTLKYIEHLERKLRSATRGKNNENT